MSRAAGIGGPVALIVAGIVLAVAGVEVVAFALVALGAVGLTSWFFYEVGLSEDRDLERERRARRGAGPGRGRGPRPPPRPRGGGGPPPPHQPPQTPVVPPARPGL